MRDADRLKDKIEVSLDSRQIFFLFFGGAVAACLVFVLGVMVGRRLEGREQLAKRAETSTVVDPLAALDELGADEQAQDLVYPTELTRAKSPLPPSPPPPAAPAPAPAPAPAAVPVPAAVPAPVVAPAAAAPAPAAAAAAKVEPEKPRPAEEKPKSKSRFTLQISSFQSRAEADAFVAKLPASVGKPYIIQSEVPGKGTYFRVRVGDYGSNDEAITAKTDFENTHHIIAYVTKL